MNRTRICWAFGLLTILALASLGTTQESFLTQNKDTVLREPEVQTRGPLHEAFAQPLQQQPEPSEPTQKEPPPPLPEDPPAERPDVEDAQWIPGYWAWDAERQDFIWISGVYRVPPKGRSFVPGYWTNSKEGYRWVSGFWSDASQQEIPYTPEPPAPLEQQIEPPPNDDAMYIPGTWIYQDTRFVWRPGYYAAAVRGRVWVPSHYVWTPNGYLFINGYWDYPYDDRGIVYAPVYFSSPLWSNPGWRYRPRYVVGYNAFLGSAFVRAGSFSFYFGNYYGSNYARLGYSPWYNGRGRYDPVFAYHGWQNHRGNPNWVGGVQTLYAQRAAGTAAAPPRTFGQQTDLVRTQKVAPLVTPATDFRATNFKLVETTPSQVNSQLLAAQRARENAMNRQAIEARNGSNLRTLSLAEINTPTRTVAPTRTTTTPIQQEPSIRNLTTPQPQITRPQPQVNVPQQTVPKQPVPQMPVIPQQTVPKQSVPQISVPQIVPQQPRPQLPQIQQPRIQQPQIQQPQIQQPQIQQPQIQQPRPQIQQVIPQKIQTPQIQQPRPQPQIQQAQPQRIQAPPIQQPRPQAQQIQQPRPQPQAPRPAPAARTPPRNAPAPAPVQKGAPPPSAGKKR